MSGSGWDLRPAVNVPGADGKKPSEEKKTWWKKIADAYQRRPLFYGFFTLLGLTLLAAALSPLMSSAEPNLGGRFGREETTGSRLVAIGENLNRMDEFGQMPYAELLRDTLNPWMRQLKPPGAWEADPYLFELSPQFRIAAEERQRLALLIDELQKKLGGKTAEKAGALKVGDVKGPDVKGPGAKGPLAGQPEPKPKDKGKEADPEIAKKNLAALVAQLQNLDANVKQARARLTQELSALTFSLEDVFIIEGTVWLRDVSNRVRERLAARSRGAVDGLALAQELFDWTVRNVTFDWLVRDGNLEQKEEGAELLWESLLWGRGPSATRAWVFIELCRQQGLDAVMLGYRDPADPIGGFETRYKFWIPAVILSPAGAPPDLYLFDHRWGIPIPGPGGKGVATLTQAASSPAVLAQLDGVRNYPVRSSHLADVVAMLDVSPHLMSRRMQVLEDELRTANRGAARLVLTLELGKLAARLQQIKGVSRVEGWPWPFQCETAARQLSPQARRTGVVLFALEGVEEKGQRNETLKKEQESRFLEGAFAEPKPTPGEAPITLEIMKRRKREQRVPGFLWRGRVLHFRGVFADVDDSRRDSPHDQPTTASRKGASNVYQTGRITDADLEELRQETEKDLKTLEKTRQEVTKTPVSEMELAQLDQGIAHFQTRLRQMPELRLDRQLVRLMATGWIGQVAYERGDEATSRSERAGNGQARLAEKAEAKQAYSDAAAYFRHLLAAEARALRETLDVLPKEPSNDAEKRLRQYADETLEPLLKVWTTAANYNLARALEAAGQYEEAIKAYGNDTSDQRPGSQYRARRLEAQRASPAKKAEAEPAKPSG